MLTPSQILVFAHTHTLSKNILVEYYQHEILGSFFRLKGSELYSFIGGTAIRICYSGPRFSEDLDFDSTDLSHFDTLCQELVAALTAKGFVVEMRLVHKGAYHCYLKFPSILKALGLSGYAAEKLLIKFEATNLGSLYTHPHLLNNYGVFANIKVAPPATLLSKKLLAVMSRRRPKGRDLFDITYLWSLAEPDLNYLTNIGKTSLPQLLHELSQFVRKQNLEVLAKEVSPFIANQNDLDRVRHFDQFLKKKI